LLVILMPKWIAASLCLGVQEYADRRFAISEDRLSYAATDAMWFHKYLFDSDTQTNRAERHLLLLDQAATRAALEEAVRRLASFGEFDLVVIFLAGHGARSGQLGWYSCADAVWGQPDLDGATLAQLLEPLQAQAVVVLVDCCHAAAVVHGTDFFSKLGGMNARVFLGSSRADQRSWEDGSLQAGLFTHLLRDALSPSAEGGLVDLDRDLVPRLQRELPLLAMRTKQGAAQDPVRIGAVSQPVSLPRLGQKFAPTSETVRRTTLTLLRRAALASAILVIAGIAVVEALTYHFAVESGRIVLRFGLRELAWIVPRFAQTRLDTGSVLEDLLPTGRDSIQDGAVEGIWPSRNEYGVRRWVDRLRPYLIRDRAWTLHVNVSGQFPDHVTGGRFDPYRFFREVNERPWGPSNQLIARVAALGVTPVSSNRGRDLSSHELWYSIGALPLLFPDCSGAGIAKTQWDAYGPPPNFNNWQDLQRFWDSYRRTVAVGYDEDFSLFMGLARAVRSNHATDAKTVLKLSQALSDAFAVLLASRALHGNRSLTEAERQELLRAGDAGCDPWLASAAAKFARDPQLWTIRLVARLHRDQVSPSDAVVGINGLLWVQAVGGSLDDQVADALRSALASPAFPFELFVPSYDISDTPRYGADVVSWLLDAAEAYIAEGQFDQSALPLAVAASQSFYLLPTQVERLRTLIGKVNSIDSLRDVRDLADGYLGHAGYIDAQTLNRLVAEVDWSQTLMPGFEGLSLSPQPGVQFNAVPMMLLDGTRISKLVAIGRIAQHVCLSAGGIEKLRRFLIANLTKYELTDLFRGLAAQGRGPTDAENQPEAIAQRTIADLRAQATEDLRQLEIRLIVARAGAWSMDQRTAIIDRLRAGWAIETEYEVRAVLADLTLALEQTAAASLHPSPPLYCNTTKPSP
jgi:hypothetical protein